MGYVLTFALDIAPAYALLIMNTSAQKFEFFFFCLFIKKIQLCVDYCCYCG